MAHFPARIGGKIAGTSFFLASWALSFVIFILVCIGSGGAQKNAYGQAQKGLNIIILPTTIDNDVAMTDIIFGYDTVLSIATEIAGHFLNSGTLP